MRVLCGRVWIVILVLALSVITGSIIVWRASSPERMLSSRDLVEWKVRVLLVEGGVVRRIVVRSRGESVNLYADPDRWKALPIQNKKRLVETASDQLILIRERFGLQRDQFDLSVWTHPFLVSKPDETIMETRSGAAIVSWKTHR
jgi:hypothetical protein